MKTKLPALLIVAAFWSLIGCAWLQDHQPQIQAVGKVALHQIANQAFTIAANTLLDEAKSGFTADIGYALQANARESLPVFTSSDSLKKYLEAWNNSATRQLAEIVPHNLAPPAVQKVALVIADSQAAALPMGPNPKGFIKPSVLSVPSVVNQK